MKGEITLEEVEELLRELGTPSPPIEQDPVAIRLRLVPKPPKPGSVKAAVLNLMLGMPDGICRRDAANLIDVYELSNRIGELLADGWVIHKSRCTRHNHKQRFTCYSI